MRFLKIGKTSHSAKTIAGIIHCGRRHRVSSSARLSTSSIDCAIFDGMSCSKIPQYCQGYPTGCITNNPY